MRGKNPKIFLEDILESIIRIEKYVKGKTKKEFLDNYEKQDAIIKRLEIIGEAVKNISPEIKKKHPEIPWKDMAGMRDILVHEYFGVIMDRVWDTAKNDIPKLKKQIKELL
ncbi:hypothetical protein A2Z53_02505 [Candidatus Giovannonibacteria bacterium RIFCSPHIGHO2_02_42_15]|uniref:DUF86 domain-containing protein n=1 Tax=Candidatus Giovannonibacteria bacterium RIFCSPHIGHO2_02_42_15 TaxID=1798329 RepID=A0A1F5VN60_9BACT|nr:MAG: hypothetical protein A2Z53_02505 [Candidatus Giovannonibacteria bacterium RIFCSPHIGHO2_02_42_15]